jgi:uncharacterized protein YndB with AHSA1/START domain
MAQLVVTRTVQIGALRAAVWAAITQPELLSEWFPDSAELDATVGAPGSLTWNDHGTFPLVVVEVDEPNVFAIRWATEPGADAAPGTSTLARFTLEDADGGTRLTVVETGWEELAGDIDAAMEDHRGGWAIELDELVAVLEKQDSQ